MPRLSFFLIIFLESKTGVHSNQLATHGPKLNLGLGLRPPDELPCEASNSK